MGVEATGGPSPDPSPDPPPSAQLCVIAAESAFEVPGACLHADSLLRLVERKRANRQRASEFGGRGWESVVNPGGPEPTRAGGRAWCRMSTLRFDLPQRLAPCRGQCHAPLCAPFDEEAGRAQHLQGPADMRLWELERGR